MMPDPESDLWKIGSIADNLRDILKPTYAPLMDTISHVAEVLRLLTAHLDLKGL